MITQVKSDINRIVKVTYMDKSTSLAENWETAWNFVFMSVKTKRTLKINKLIEETINTMMLK